MIEVLLFAELRDKVGKDKIALEITQVTIKELKRILETDYALNKLDGMMFAVNEEYATDEQTVQSGDTVAIIPPVSGG